MLAFFFSALLSTTLSAVIPSPAGETVLRIGGNGSGMGAIRLVAQAYQDLHPETTVKVVPNLGSSGGIAALRHGALDLAISARPLKPEERAPGMQATEYARTPFIFAAHRGVRKSDLSTPDLIAIYRQKRTHWPDGTRIRLILRPESDADTVYIKKISLEVARAVESAHARRGMAISVTDQDCLNDISRTPGSFGATTLTQVLTEPHPLQEFSFNGVAPTLKNLADGSYPLVKRYYLVLPGKGSPQARQFALFLNSSRAREILHRAGALPCPPAKER